MEAQVARCLCQQLPHVCRVRILCASVGGANTRERTSTENEMMAPSICLTFGIFGAAGQNSQKINSKNVFGDLLMDANVRVEVAQSSCVERSRFPSANICFDGIVDAQMQTPRPGN